MLYDYYSVGAIHRVNVTAQVQQVFPNNYQTSPFWRFPFKTISTVSPTAGLDYHSVRTLTPCESLVQSSLGVFLNSAPYLLASFAVRVSSKSVSSLPPKPLKAGYTAHSFGPHTGSSQPVALHHPTGSPRSQGQRLHAFVDRPNFLTLSTNPRLGVSSQHQELHRCALSGFLGPPSKVVALTRILHHLRTASFKV